MSELNGLTPHRETPPVSAGDVPPLATLTAQLAALLQSGEPVSLTLESKAGLLRLDVSPASVVPLGPGLWLSPCEETVVRALAQAGEPLPGKKIAARARLPYGGQLRVILSNLVSRRILRRASGGYTLPPSGDKEVCGPGAG